MGATATIGQIIVAGGMAGARPALTLLALQVYAFFALGEEGIPPELAWLITVYALAAVAAAAIVEHFARTDPELDELLALPNAIIGAAAATLISVLLVVLGAPPAETEAPTAAGLPLALAGIGEDAAERLPLILVGAVLSVGTSLLVGWTRRQLLAALDIVAVPGRLVRWLETGTVAGALALVLLFPVIAVALAVLVVVGSSASAFVVRAVERRRDQVARQACECGYLLRGEALLCPSCGAEREPSVALGTVTDDE